MQERKVAVDSLRSVAQLLTEAYQPLHDTVHGRSDVPEHHSLDTTFLAVKATADVRPSILLRMTFVMLWDVLMDGEYGVTHVEHMASLWECMASGICFVHVGNTYAHVFALSKVHGDLLLGYLGSCLSPGWVSYTERHEHFR